jgi:ferric-dicitrate binding protein FerR (iron transport regulator)
MEEQHTLDLIRKFIRNECSSDELDAVQALIRSGIDESLWQRALQEEQTSVEDKEIVLDAEHNRILYSKIGERIVGKKPRVRQIYIHWLGWTAAAAASVILGFFVFTWWSGSALEDGRELLVSTQYHEHRELKLGDGSQVWVNSRSALRYPERFSRDQRKVYLEGEAFFQITKDPEKPFIVQTGRISVRVLGTSFNVKSFDNEDQTVITLTSGKVQVQGHDGHTEEMIPGDQMVYNKTAGRFHKQRVDVTGSSAWRENVLQFTSAPLPEVLRALERWYGVHIRIAGPELEDTRITFRQRDQGLKKILDMLAFTARMNYAIQGDSVILSPK